MNELTDLVKAEKEYMSATAKCIKMAPELFRKFRQERKLSQRALASQLGCSHPYISKIENGHIRAGRPILLKLGQLMSKK